MKAAFVLYLRLFLMTIFQLVIMGKEVVRMFWALPQGSGFQLYLFVFPAQAEIQKRMSLQSLTHQQLNNKRLNISQNEFF